MGFLKPHSDKIYAGFRIIFGGLFACHGLQKLGILAGGPPEMNTLIWAAGIIEAVGGLVIMVGFQTAIAAFLASGMMAVAYFMVHQPQGLLPVYNQGELAALYCWAFLYMAARGSGIWSIDGAIR